MTHQQQPRESSVIKSLLRYVYPQSRKRKILGGGIMVGVLLFIWFWNCLPSPLFDTPTSTVLRDREGQLLGAKIATDGQWRFPRLQKVPDKYRKALIHYEDKRFQYHLGVDPLAVGRALWQNIKAGKIVSGASTITMQVIRLARGNQSRTVWEKFIEAIWATRLELTYSKEEILTLYASHAPYGGNVVGLQASSWRYFGRQPEKLSWGETATLTVLPNHPGLIHPGRNRALLREKRDFLLHRLEKRGVIDSITFRLAKAEPLPKEPLPLPQATPHLLARVHQAKLQSHPRKPSNVRATLEKHLQQKVTKIIHRHHKKLRQNEIHNAAALVADVKTGNVRAYVGNVDRSGQSEKSYVDCITAPRSTGSILKPFLFAAMLDQGELLPGTLIPDIPTRIGSFAPQNYKLGFDGAVPARRALARSLNVPAVRMLDQFGVPKFHHLLRQLKLTTINDPPGHYGLSLILGGAEATLWDLAGAYASMARTLNHYTVYNGHYNPDDFRSLNYLWEGRDTGTVSPPFDRLNKSGLLNAAPIWHTFKAMLEVKRPQGQRYWREFASSQKIAWKTGTSFGFRDAWAIGCTPGYVVGVWVGNADGEGRPGLTGLNAAAPILFDVFEEVESAGWFHSPYDEMQKVRVCERSGYRANPHCQPVDSNWVPQAGLRTAPCPYHRLVHLDETGEWRVQKDCAPGEEVRHKSWFLLPPAMEWYYQRKHQSYAELPPYHPNCKNGRSASSVMELLYPTDEISIYIPVNLSGEKEQVVFEAAHRQEGITIFWHLDGQYLGQTDEFHQMAATPEPGWHKLVLVDKTGRRLEQRFKIVEK